MEASCAETMAMIQKIGAPRLLSVKEALLKNASFGMGYALVQLKLRRLLGDEITVVQREGMAVEDGSPTLKRTSSR